MVEIPLLVQNAIQWEQHTSTDEQLSFFENAIKDRLPPIVPKFPAA
jgi:hypothetical protein